MIFLTGFTDRERLSFRHKPKVYQRAILGLVMGFTSFTYAAPFTQCPSKAFLLQGKPVAAYGVNLVTGNFSVIAASAGVDANINGLGFDEKDRYIYGFNTTDLQLVRLGSDFQAQTLNLSGLPDNTSFYVGDVSDHFYYVYRAGTGFYKIDLSPLDQDVSAPLTAQLITATSNIKLTDFSFHPNTNKIYGVDNNSGELFQIDPANGETIALGFTGERGTFGAMYFDVNGYFYLSRNQDGKIYRIDLSSLTLNTTLEALMAVDISAIEFADGPSSGQNDGARCASAPLIDEDVPSIIDFGDAPQSYGTLLQDNGARHLLDGKTYLGLTAPDGDYNGYIGSDSDDSTEVNALSTDDEEGVNFVTPFEAGLDSVVSVYASDAGILSAWFDWNINGVFEQETEQAINNVLLTKGENVIALRVPEEAILGATWSRFRFSQQANLGPKGGSTSGEVEDHPINVNSAGLSYRYYPSENAWVTLAYEDQWPQNDDYDMNDVVMQYKTVEVIRDNKVVRIDIKGELQALGGYYHNGFAILLDHVLTDNVNKKLLRLLHNDIKQNYSGENGATKYPILEEDNTNAVIIVSQDLWKHTTSLCKFHRTEKNCPQAQTFDFELSIPLISSIPVDITASMLYNPFIFATEGLYHGDIFESHPGRSLEIHLVDKGVSDKFNTAFFGLADDTSDITSGRYFRNKNNLPWALEITEQWRWPIERTPLIEAYPKFKPFVESQGDLNINWYEADQAAQNLIFK